MIWPNNLEGQDFSEETITMPSSALGVRIQAFVLQDYNLLHKPILKPIKLNGS